MYSSNIFKPSVNSVISTGIDSKIGLSLYFMGCVDFWHAITAMYNYHFFLTVSIRPTGFL